MTDEQDRRYRVMVLLNREDRRGLWTFYCPQCTMPVAELYNSNVSAMTDTFDTVDSIAKALTGVRCDGRYENAFGSKEKCRVWYYFSLGEK